jgi:hypothetical protein
MEPNELHVFLEGSSCLLCCSVFGERLDLQRQSSEPLVTGLRRLLLTLRKRRMPPLSAFPLAPAAAWALRDEQGQPLQMEGMVNEQYRTGMWLLLEQRADGQVSSFFPSKAFP